MRLDTHRKANKRELLEEIVTLLLDRAAKQKYLAIYAGCIKKAEQMEYACKVLGDLAGEVKCMELKEE